MSTQVPPAGDAFSAPSDTPSGKRKRWLIVAIVVVLVRLYVVGEDEVIPIRHDSTNYAMGSEYLAGGDPFSTLPTHRPGLSILAWAVTELGIPYKLFLDGVLVATGLFAGMLVERLTRSFVAGLALSLAIAFNPWFIAHARMLMTEPLIAILLLLNLLLSLSMVGRPVARWTFGPACLAAVVSSIYAASRNETVLLAFFWALILGVVLFRQRKSVFRKGFLFRRGGWRLALVALPLLSAWISLQAIRFHHHRQYGLGTVCVTEAGGFNQLMNALYTIVPEEELRFAPVTRQSLEDACDVSSVLNRYREPLLDVNRASYRHARDRLGLEGQFGTWMNWHLVNCFRGVNRKTDDEMRQAAREIREAQDQGRLPRRLAFYPVNPYWEKWLPAVPGDFWLTLKYSLLRQHCNLTKTLEKLYQNSAVASGYFDDGVLRRHGMGEYHELRIHGRLLKPASVATAARLTTPDGEFLCRYPVYLNTTENHMMFSFRIDDVENRKVRGPLILSLLGENGATVESASVPLKHERTIWKELTFPTADGERVSESWMLSTNRFTPDRGLRFHIQTLLIRYHRLWLIVLCVSGFVAGFRYSGHRAAVRTMAWIVGIAWTFVLVRCLFYALINVWLQWGLGRYVEPNNLTIMFALVGTAFVPGALIGGRFRKRPAAP